MDGDIKVLAFGAVRCCPLEWKTNREAAVGRPRLVPRHGIREVGVLCWDPRFSKISYSVNNSSHPYLCFGGIVRWFVDVPVLVAVRGRVGVAEYYSIVSHLCT